MVGHGRQAGSGRDSADFDGQRRRAGRLRRGFVEGGHHGCEPARDRLGRGGQRRAHVRRDDNGRCGGCPGGHHLSLRRGVDLRRERGAREARAGSKAMTPDFSKGLVPAVVQDAETGKVLMLAYMDEEAWAKTRETGQAWFHSRTRGLWEKGATSGNTMEVVATRTPSSCASSRPVPRATPGPNPASSTNQTKPHKICDFAGTPKTDRIFIQLFCILMRRWVEG